MMIEYHAENHLCRVVGVDILEQRDELGAAVAIFGAREEVARMKLDENGQLTPESLTESGFVLSFQDMAYDPDSKLMTSAENYNRMHICLPVVKYPEFAQADFTGELYRIVEKH
ncbi:MAG: hypothetical protein LBP58_04035 [Azoarcus sp.]|jgi:hypothetical protein|nr:hypothetical protein [Azoarcus sp.]